MIESGLSKKLGRFRTVGTVPHAALVMLNGILIRGLLGAGVLGAGILGGAVAHAAELAPHDMALLDRLTWGINGSSAAHLEAGGVERGLCEQLHPAPNGAFPASAQTQIEAMPDVHKFPFDIAIAFEQQ